MAYHPEVMRETRQKHKEKVRDFNEKEESKKVALLERSPSLKQLNDQLDKLSFRMAYSALMGNPQEIQNIRKDAEAIHEKQGEILAEMGEAKDALRPHYMCAKCEDAGSTGEADCDCLLEAYREGLIEHYAMYLGDASFEAFRKDLYSTVPTAGGAAPQVMANYALAVCQTYADAFCAEKGDGLLIHGACGVGKSFLGAAVARRVMERGYYVHCISAIELFSIYERSRFGRCEEDERFVLEAALEADLLFLDDLGNEVASPQNAPFLARLLNERINGKKGTILVSQYSSEELAKRYSPQIGSRIKGSLTDIYIMGSDLRNQIK